MERTSLCAPGISDPHHPSVPSEANRHSPSAEIWVPRQWGDYWHIENLSLPVQNLLQAFATRANWLPHSGICLQTREAILVPHLLDHSVQSDLQLRSITQALLLSIPPTSKGPISTNLKVDCKYEFLCPLGTSKMSKLILHGMFCAWFYSTAAEQCIS